MDDIGELIDDLATWIAGGASLEGGLARLRRYQTPEDVIETVREEYERRTGRIRELKDPGALVDRQRDLGYWYVGPKDSDRFWPALQARLDLDEDAMRSVDRSSTRIVSLLDAPGQPAIDLRGLVLGYVQSGKTTSFMSVIAKAADAGYRLFIVMSGVTDNLRLQTQERLDDLLIGQLEGQWYRLTDEEDFHQNQNAANVLGRTDHRLLGVVKKNPSRLRRLVNWINSAERSVLQNCPILIIDDEADQASIDVGKRGRTSRINGLIRQLLENPKAAYVAYTATPFANLLINPAEYRDLYPRDFIVDLPRPDNYVGPEKIFGREALDPAEDGDVRTEGLDVIRHVNEENLTAVRPPPGKGAVETWEPEATPSLTAAVRWFVLATAARQVRGTGNRHSTMLIHTSMLAAAHERMKEPVRSILDDLADASDGTTAELRALWEAETARVPQPAGLAVSWERVTERLPDVLDEVRILVDNYRSQERLSYPPGEAVTAIVIGGNTLSRGLTLEGLVSSYFVRAASAYDTLLQMGRWFGYRGGYEDLTRVWMTPELETWFFDLATVEEEIRRDIRRYEAEELSPQELAVKIRTHPAMAITSAAKMRHAVTARVSYGGSKQQTILFNHRDGDWLLTNQEATRRLVADALGDGVSPETRADRRNRTILRNVDSGRILEFLDRYLFHERAFQMRSALLGGYIRSQDDQGFLRRWNIVVMGHPDRTNGSIPLGLDEDVGLIQRARLDMPGITHANIKTLVSTVDRVSDTEQSTAEVRAMITGDATDAALLARRQELIGDVGLLGIYPIARDSQPAVRVPKKDGARRRLPLDAVEDVIGVGFFFPESRGRTEGASYLSADLSDVTVEENDDIDRIDELDEEAATRQTEATGR